jgi:predicted transglutaminase-like protease
MCFIYDEYAELYKEKDVKAKKEHKCSECARTIFKNETYQYIFTIFQGDATTTKICSDCKDKRQKIHDIEISHGCSENESWPPLGELREYLQHYE